MKNELVERNISCANPATNLCVIAEITEGGKQAVITDLGPSKDGALSSPGLTPTRMRMSELVRARFLLAERVWLYNKVRKALFVSPPHAASQSRLLS